MRNQALGVLPLLAALALNGCYALVYRPQDERNVRRQLHVPGAVPLVAFDSSPKEAGFFGREGLRISAVFQFDPERLDAYVAALDDPGVWQPVSFLSYSPDRADEYTATALGWSGLPFPDSVSWRFRYWEHAEAVRAVARGRYYASMILARQGARVDHPDGGHHYQWDYVGVNCAEAPEEGSAVIFTFAVLDLEAGKLYALIAFSG